MLKATPVFQVILVLLPVIGMIKMVSKFRFDTLFLDDWSNVPLYEKAVKGSLAWSDLWAGYLEHRVPVPRALSIAGVLLTHGDMTVHNWMAVAVLVMTWLGVGVFLLQSLGAWKRVWFPWMMTGWALCSAVHWQTLLFPNMMLMALPGVFLVLALLVLGADRVSFWPKLGLVFFFSVLGMWSCASGLTLVGIIPFVAWCGYGFADRRSMWRFVGLLMAGFAVVVAHYFYRLKSEVPPTLAYAQENGADTLSHDVGGALAHPERLAPFTVTLCGANLTRGINAPRRETAQVLGVAVLVAAAAGAGWLWLRRTEGMLARGAPFLGMGAYGFCSAVLITLGRAWASPGEGGALNNRYSTIMAFLIVAIIAFGAMVLQSEGLKHGSRLRRVVVPVTTVLMLLLMMNFVHGRQMMALWQASRLKGAVDNHFAAVLGLSGYGKNPGVRHQVSLARQGVRTMNELGFLVRPMAKDAKLSQFESKGALASNLGGVDEVIETAESVFLRGRALLAVYGRSADAILITARAASAPKSEAMIIRAAYSDELPTTIWENNLKDFHHMLKDDIRSEIFGRWSTRLDKAALPAGESLIECHALDFKDGRVKSIGQPFKIVVPTQGTTPSGPGG